MSESAGEKGGEKENAAAAMLTNWIKHGEALLCPSLMAFSFFPTQAAIPTGSKHPLAFILQTTGKGLLCLGTTMWGGEGYVFLCPFLVAPVISEHHLHCKAVHQYLHRKVKVVYYVPEEI